MHGNGPSDEERDSVAPQPEEIDPADAGGDSPGPPIGVPDRLSASNKPGTTAEEQGEPSLERRLEMERPDVWETGRAGEPPGPPNPIIDDDVPVDELNVDEPHFDPGEADMDRTPQETGEESVEPTDEGPEAAAMHVEPG
jgi:hypothetical protein